MTSFEQTNDLRTTPAPGLITKAASVAVTVTVGVAVGVAV